MCGIAGVFFYSADQYPGPLVKRMAGVQKARGPDYTESWVSDDGHIAFGTTRLSVTGHGPQAQQPFGHRSMKMIYNGEIYNAPEVMCSMDVTHSAEHSDGWALLHTYLEGYRNLNSLRGMFAFAAYDEAKAELHIGRDSVGKKPLYYTRLANGFAFASTIEALKLSIAAPLPIRSESVEELLIFKSIGGTKSAFKNIEQLPPGHVAIVSRNGDLTIRKWHSFPEPYMRESVVGLVKQEIAEAIRLRSPVDQPITVFLSGGLDSSIIAIETAKNTDNVLALTAVYESGGDHDEGCYAQAMAKHIGLRFIPVMVRNHDVPELLHAAIRATEDPISDPVIVATMAVSRKAAENSKVIATGDGSDEFWLGYQRMQQNPVNIIEYLRSTMVFQPEELGVGFPESYIQRLSVGDDSGELLDQVSRIEVMNRMRNYHLARVDKICSAASLEARCAFLDLRVTELAMSIPASVKLPNDRPKGLLTDAFKHDLPQWLLDRKKQPFSCPIKSWLYTDLFEMTHDLVGSSRSITSGYINANCLLAKLSDRSLDNEAAMKLWSCLVAEIWYRENT